MKIVSVVRDYEMYDRVIRSNPYLKDSSVGLAPIDNRQENLGLSSRYNQFIDSRNYDQDEWLIFCHEDWQLLEDPLLKLNKLSPQSLYGVFGARLIEQKNETFHEFVGQIYDRSKTGQFLRQIGKPFEPLTQVDCLDCQALIVNASAILQYDLRFDENLEWDLYVEDFCYAALTNHNISAHVIDLACCHWSQLDNPFLRKSCRENLPYLERKYAGNTFAGIVGNIGPGKHRIKPNSGIDSVKAIKEPDFDAKKASALAELHFRAKIRKLD